MHCTQSRPGHSWQYGTPARQNHGRELPIGKWGASIGKTLPQSFFSHSRRSSCSLESRMHKCVDLEGTIWMLLTFLTVPWFGGEAMSGLVRRNSFFVQHAAREADFATYYYFILISAQWTCCSSAVPTPCFILWCCSGTLCDKLEVLFEMILFWQLVRSDFSRIPLYHHNTHFDLHLSHHRFTRILTTTKVLQERSI